MTQRELPENQRKIEEGKEKEESDMMAMDRAIKISSQMETVKDRTINENTVLGEIEDINTSSTNNRIFVDIDLPGEGSNMTKRFNKPKVWSDDYKFVRWIREYGYDADSFPNMLRDNCKVKVSKEDSSYTLYIPEKEEEGWEGTEKVTNGFSGLLDKAKVPYHMYASMEFELISSTMAIIWLIHAIATVSTILTYDLSTPKLAGIHIIVAIAIIILNLMEHSLLEDIGGRY